MSPSGTAILNRDNAYYALLITAAWSAGLARALGFGADPEADARLIHCDIGDTGSAVAANICGQDLTYRLHVPGRHWVLNSLAVLAAISAVGGQLDTAAAALSQLSAPSLRGGSQHIALPGGQLELIDDSYNASPAAVRAAIAVLATKKPGSGGRRIAVLGDMLELGRSSEIMHAALARDLKSAGIDKVLLAGEKMASLDATLPASMRGGYAQKSEQLRPLVLTTLQPGDIVLVKGSLGSRMGLIADAIRGLTSSNMPPRTAICI